MKEKYNRSRKLLFDARRLTLIIQEEKMSKKVNAEMLKMDRRVIHRKILAGELLEKDLAALLKKIPDVAENAEEISLEENENKNHDD